MFKNITEDNQTKYTIKESGKHIFYFENKSGEITFSIESEKAKVFIFGLYQGKEKNKFNLKTNQHHKYPNSESHLLIKTVLDNESQFDYEGKIRIERKAQKTQASLKNQNLIISDNAKVSTLPQLEILPNEVKCSHSATVSDLNKAQLYFLMSRGVSESDAKNLLIQGFIEEILKVKETKNC
ncbi:MAG: SufD family Fe-S cluster assembly protein [Candidatus Moranbacteria bacterium]|nr:SufD family Fe-S cluster assembly protein [Candidatus Moranbacteria bacterium]